MVPGDDDLVACPQGESDAYAASLLPMKGSEDARKLLAVKFPPAGPEPDFESLLYDAALDWLVEIPIRVAAPQGTSFEGKVIWDVMMSLGMHWGDMDLFHWENDGLTTGHDHLFSVMTSTRPGCFLPDRIAAGKVRVADLIFGFSIARSGAPELVAGAMVRAADYAAKRLGGLLEMPGRPFVQPAFLAEVARLSRELTASGFPPGAPRTMRLF